MLIGGMMVTYVQKLQRSLKFTNREHVKLCNYMHEGLLIVNNSTDQTKVTDSHELSAKTNKTVMFSNKQANKILGKSFGEIEDKV